MNPDGPIAAQRRIKERLQAGQTPDEDDFDILDEFGVGLYDDPEEMDEFWQNEAKWRIQDPGSGWAHHAGLGQLLQGEDPALVVYLTDPSWKGGAANEEIMHRIWDAFGTLVELNERLAKHSEDCYQSELARIEKQPKSRPVLFQFPNKDDREFFTRPWLQVLMYIARTQVRRAKQRLPRRRAAASGWVGS